MPRKKPYPSFCKGNECAAYDYCTKQQAVCNFYADFCSKGNNNNIEKPLNNTLLFLLNDLIQQECKAQEVSEYILGSKELLLASNSPCTELHIITNELVNYDRTVVAKMAISSNILGNYSIANGYVEFTPKTTGVKYVYYCPKSFEQDFSLFKEEISKYIRRDDDSRKEVDQWIRRNYSRRNKLLRKLSQLQNRSPEDFVSCLFVCTQEAKRNELINYCKETSYFPDNDFQIPVDIKRWLQGNSRADTLKEVGKFHTFLCNLCELCLKNSSFVSYKSFKEFTIESISRSIDKLYSLSKWQLEDKQLTADERREIFEFIFSDIDDDHNNIDYNWNSIKEQFEKWLAPGEADLCGALIIDSSVVSEALENIVFVPVEPNNITLCFNFCLFIPNSTTISACWYATARQNTQGSIAVDNTIFMFNTDKHDWIKRFKEGYAALINSDENIKNKLRSVNSKILTLLGMESI